MKIIKQHRIDVIRQELFKKLKKLMNKKKEKKSCASILRKEQKVFANKHIIDDFIDEYWVLNCPESYSVAAINDQIYKFFHQMHTLNKEITVHQ